MSQPSYLPGLFPQSGYRAETCAWHDMLRDDARSCMLIRMEFCKTKGDNLHEFLILHFSHPTHPAARAVVVVDRAVKDFSLFSIIVSPIVAFQNAMAALDKVYVLGGGENVESYLSRAYGQYDKLCVLSYPSAESPVNLSSPTPPSAIQLSTLLVVVTKHRPNYNLYKYNCYWYADTIFEACKNLFPGYQEECDDLKHGYRGGWRMKLFKLVMHTGRSLPYISNEYNVEWNQVAQDQEPIAQEDLERRVEEEQRRSQGLARELEETKRRCEQLEASRSTSPHNMRTEGVYRAFFRWLGSVDCTCSV